MLLGRGWRVTEIIRSKTTGSMEKACEMLRSMAGGRAEPGMRGSKNVQ